MNLVANIYLAMLACEIAGALNTEENFGPFMVPERKSNQFVEIFKEPTRDYEYHFHQTAATWSQAASICRSDMGRLAELEGAGVPEIVAIALSESVIGNQAMWIGAKLIDGAYRWITDNEPMMEDECCNTNMWAEDPPNAELVMVNRTCVAFERKGHDSPTFVKLDCNLMRPFICHLRSVESHEISEIKPPITLRSYRYHLFLARVTWEEAVVYCLKNSYTLSTITNEEVNEGLLESLADKMLRARPVLESAWIGASYDYNLGSWFWLRRGVRMMLPKVADPGTGYPPWYHEMSTSESGCVLLDRHLSEEPVFLPTYCQRRKAFICEEMDTKNHDWTNPYKHYYGSREPMSWVDAMQACQRTHHSAQLVSFQTVEQMKIVTDIMATNEFEMNHIWTGGKMIFPEKKYYWMHSIANKSEPISDDLLSNFLFDTAKGFEPTMSCLNMDRVNHNHPVLYGLNCHIRQHFICFSLNGDAYTAFTGRKPEIPKSIELPHLDASYPQSFKKEILPPSEPKEMNSRYAAFPIPPGNSQFSASPKYLTSPGFLKSPSDNTLPIIKSTSTERPHAPNPP